MNWYIAVLKKYAVFSGRARRKEYWYFILFNCIITLVLYGIDGMTGTINSSLGGGLLGGIYALAVLIPGIAVLVRRLHDTGRHGGWVLLALLPFIGAIVLLIFTVQDSKPGGNQYGDNPKEVAVAD
jgi:uncharacterized membrane protein YhaH (DUF805 family)